MCVYCVYVCVYRVYYVYYMCVCIVYVCVCIMCVCLAAQNMFKDFIVCGVVPIKLVDKEWSMVSHTTTHVYHLSVLCVVGGIGL